MYKYIKVILVVVVVLVGGNLFAQDVVILKHKNYTSHFSKSKKYPVVVEWWVTKAKVGCPTPLPRKDNFKPDPQLPTETNIGPDYIKSGYDRGHVTPAADNLCQTQEEQDECFYYSNMLPQTHTLNAGIWKTLETQTRLWALEQDSIQVWAGGIGEKAKIGSVSVPELCWKVLYFKSTKSYQAFLFKNDKDKPLDLPAVRVPLQDIEKLTILKFVPKP